MPDFSPLRTGQLVVRFHSSWRRRVVLIGAAVGVLMLFYVMYEWGRFEGGYSKFAEVQRRRELAAQIETLDRDNEKLRAEAASAELARNVDDKAYADVEKNLADLQAQVLKAPGREGALQQRAEIQRPSWTTLFTTATRLPKSSVYLDIILGIGRDRRRSWEGGEFEGLAFT